MACITEEIVLLMNAMILDRDFLYLVIHAVI